MPNIPYFASIDINMYENIRNIHIAIIENIDVDIIESINTTECTYNGIIETIDTYSKMVFRKLNEK